MEKFYYYLEERRKKRIIKTCVSVKYDKLDEVMLNFYNEPFQSSDLAIKLTTIIALLHDQENFYYVINELKKGIKAGKTVKQLNPMFQQAKNLMFKNDQLSFQRNIDCIERISNGIDALKDIVEKEANYYQRIMDCITITYVDSIPFSEVNNRQDFFCKESDYQSNKVKEMCVLKK